MAPAVRTERADAPGQPDQRRVAADDVADAELGLRDVECREPARLVQRDERDDERRQEHDEHQPDEQHRAAARRRDDRRVSAIDIGVDGRADHDDGSRIHGARTYLLVSS